MHYGICCVSHVASSACFSSFAGHVAFRYCDDRMAVARPEAVASSSDCPRKCLRGHYDDCCRYPVAGAGLTLTQITGDVLFFCGSSFMGGVHASARPLFHTAARCRGYHYFRKRRALSADLVAIPAEQVHAGVYRGNCHSSPIPGRAGGVYLNVTLWFAINRLGTNTVALQMAFVPVISALAAVPLLGETISALTWGGLLAVTVGALVGARASGHVVRQRG